MRWLESRKANIDVEVVDNKNGEYFPQNKTYISGIEADRLIYLDADTIVLDSIDKVWKGAQFDFLASHDSFYRSASRAKREQWSKILTGYGCQEGPYFNSGFLVFENNSQQKIGECWEDICEREWQKGTESKLSQFQGRWTTEQMALSVAALREIGDIGAMKGNHHVYGWEKGPRSVQSDSVVYHTGSRGERHIKYASVVAQGRDLSFNRPLISGAANPLFVQLQGYDLGYRIKHFLCGL
jgi:hypothetical protein